MRARALCLAPPPSPLPETPPPLTRSFGIVNGLLLPGGGADLSPGHAFYDTAALLVKLAREANDGGDYFPVHGTCLVRRPAAPPPPPAPRRAGAAAGRWHAPAARPAPQRP